MKLGRLVIAGMLAAVVTVGLFVVMYKLIQADFQLEEKETIKVTDITMPKTEIDVNLSEAKPDKPEEPEEPPPDIPDVKVEVAAPDAVTVNIAAPSTSDLSIGLGDGFARDTDYIPVYVPQPRYPSRAQTRGVNGYAVIRVIITTTGGVRDPELLEEYPEGYGFGKSALRAAEKLKYNPRVVDGVAEEVPGVLYKFTFQIAE